MAGENFIEVTPHVTIPAAPAGGPECRDDRGCCTLARMSMVVEFNLSPGSVVTPVVDVRQLSPAALHQIEDAYSSSCRRGKDHGSIPPCYRPALLTTFHNLQAALTACKVFPARQEPVSVDGPRTADGRRSTPAVTLEPNEEVSADLDEVRVLLHQVGLDRLLLTEQSAICVLALADGASATVTGRQETLRDGARIHDITNLPAMHAAKRSRKIPVNHTVNCPCSPSVRKVWLCAITAQRP